MPIGKLVTEGKEGRNRHIKKGVMRSEDAKEQMHTHIEQDRTATWLVNSLIHQRAQWTATPGAAHWRPFELF